MKLRILILSFTLLCTLAGQSQSLNLKSGNYKLVSNINSVTYSDLKESLYEGNYYVYVQFSELPSEQVKEKLESNGLILEQFIANKTYQAKLSSSITDLGKLSVYSITGIYSIDYKHKLQSIHQADWDVFQPENDGKYAVTVMLHQSMDEIEALNFFNNYSTELIKSNLYANYFTVKSSFEQIEELAKHPMVLYIEPIDLNKVKPELSENQQKARLIFNFEYPWVHANKVNLIRKSNTSSAVFDGEGLLIALGVDSGISDHYDLKNRVDQSIMTNFSGQWSTQSAGIIAGAGNILPGGAGVAPKADLKLYNQWDAIDNYTTSVYPQGIDITTTTKSQSCLVRYNADSRLVDMQLNGFKHLMHIFNLGGRNQLACFSNPQSNFYLIAGGGYQNSKNGLTAVQVDRKNRFNSILQFQSSGPTGDYRMKPDITVDYNSVKTLHEIESYFPELNYSSRSRSHYEVFPHSITTGIYALLFQYYQDRNNGQKPPSALLKNIILNSADDNIGPIGPDAFYGWGLINPRKAVELIDNNAYIYDSISNSGNNTHALTIPSGVNEVKVMLYWHDAAAAANATKVLVNNLDLTVTTPSNTTHLPLILNLDTILQTRSIFHDAINGIDTLNNTEQVVIKNPTAGTYQININGLSVPSGPQKYYVTYIYEYRQISVTYPSLDESLQFGNEEVLWDANDESGMFKVEFSNNGGQTWVTIKDSLNGGTRRYNESNFPAPLRVSSVNALYRVSRNGIVGISEPFTIIGGVNPDVVAVCPTNFTLSWPRNPIATSYEIALMGNKFMDSITTVTDTFVVIPYPASDKIFAAVTPKLGNKYGIRSPAIEKGTTIFNCKFVNNLELTTTVPSAGALFDCIDYSTYNVGVMVRNNSFADIYGFRLKYSFNNGPLISRSLSDTLLAGDTSIIHFTTIDSLLPGYNNLFVYLDSSTQTYLPDDTLMSEFFYHTGGQTITSPYFQNFDAFNLCSTGNGCENVNCILSEGWINPTNINFDDADFRVNKNGTPSNLTGPSQNHTPTNTQGNYLYTEASLCFEKEHLLYSPCIDIAMNQTVEASFWYDMFGRDMGELHVDVIADGIIYKDYMTPLIGEKLGPQFQNWHQAKVDLSPFAGQKVNIRFRAITGVGFESDIAIDDFRLSDIVTTSLPNIEEINELSFIKVYPNPSNGTFNLQKIGDEKINIEVYSISGTRVFEKQMVQAIDQIDLTNQSKGIYFLRAIGSSVNQTIKIIYK